MPTTVDAAGIVEDVEQIGGLLPQGRVAVVQHAVDRPLVHRREQRVDGQRRVVGHADRHPVSARVEGSGPQPGSADREAVGHARGAAQRRGRGVDAQRRCQHFGLLLRAAQSELTLIEGRHLGVALAGQAVGPRPWPRTGSGRSPPAWRTGPSRSCPRRPRRSERSSRTLDSGFRILNPRRPPSRPGR